MSGECVRKILVITDVNISIPVVETEPELQSLTMNMRIKNWLYSGDYEDHETQRFVVAQEKICSSVRIRLS